MKQLITILLILISLTSFGQGGTKFTIKGNGSGGSNVGDSVKKNTDTLGIYKTLVYPNIVNTTTNTSNISLKRNISDTAGNAGVTTIFQVNKSKDSLQVNIQKNTDSLPKRWGIYGMSGLSSTANFIGNTDNVPIFFRVNNIKIGGFDTATYNGSLKTALFSLGNYLTIPTVSKSALFISDSARLSGDEYRFGQTIVVTGGKVGGTASQGQMMAGQFEPRIAADNTSNWTSSYGMVGVRGSNNIQPGATGTLTYGRSFNAVADYSAMTVTNRYGYYAENAFLHGTGIITNQYGVYIESMTGASNNFGFYSASENNVIAPTSTLTNGIKALSVTATLANVASGSNTGVDFQITGGGTSATNIRGYNLDLLAGYTGSATTIGLRQLNASLGTATFTVTGGAGNYGIQSGSTGTVAGSKIGVMGYSAGGDLNIGTYGRGIGVKNSAVNIGLLGIGRNSATSGIGIAGYFTQDTAALSTGTASTIIVDNGNQANAIALFRDNGTTKVTIADGGAMTSTSTITATQFNYSALSTAPSSASDTGTTGEVRVTNGFIYVCVATNTWQRAAITTW